MLWNVGVFLLVVVSCGVAGQDIIDKIESIEGKNAFNPHVISARMYDYLTSTIAYKEKTTKKCYIQKMQNSIPTPLYISDSKSGTREVEILAGKGIARFCQGLDVYRLLVQIKENKKS